MGSDGTRECAEVGKQAVWGKTVYIHSVGSTIVLESVRI